MALVSATSRRANSKSSRIFPAASRRFLRLLRTVRVQHRRRPVAPNRQGVCHVSGGDVEGQMNRQPARCGDRLCVVGDIDVDIEVIENLWEAIDLFSCFSATGKPMRGRRFCVDRVKRTAQHQDPTGPSVRPLSHYRFRLESCREVVPLAYLSSRTQQCLQDGLTTKLSVLLSADR